MAPPRLGVLASHPARVVSLAFAVILFVGAFTLASPWASSTGESTGFIDSLFTAASALCVTGLVVVDTGSHWSMFGQMVILGLIQVGGLGVMVVATLLALIVFGRMGLLTRQATQVETKSVLPGDVRQVVYRVVAFSLIAETAVAIVITARLITTYGEGVADSVWNGVFHSISAFNNAGFSTYPDGLVGFVTDPWIILPICAAVIVGGLGYPVIRELSHRFLRPRSWTALTRITIIMTVALLVLAVVFYAFAEHDNLQTLGGLSGGSQWLATFTTAVMPRTAGFNVIPIEALGPESLFFTDVLMFIGGGSASTAGGVKITTIGILAFVVWAEIKGRPDVTVGARRIPAATVRQAIAIVMLAFTLVSLSVIIIMAETSFAFESVLFEVVSAFATVGLSTGITPDLPDPAKVLLIVLMFTGRLGPVTLASALTGRRRVSRVQRPEERMIVG